MHCLPGEIVVKVIVVEDLSYRMQRTGGISVLKSFLMAIFISRYFEIVGVVSYGVGCNSTINGQNYK